jgi:hypothetical protein
LNETDEMFSNWKLTHLSNILHNEIKKSIHYDVKVKPFEYLKGMLYMNSLLNLLSFRRLFLQNKIKFVYIIYNI